MTGDINLGDNLNETLLGILHNILYILMGVETAIVYAIGLHITPGAHLALAPSAHFGKFRIFLYFNAPALVLGQVPVKTVHLIGCHHIYNLLHLLLAIEVTTFVEHESTP